MLITSVSAGETALLRLSVGEQRTLDAHDVTRASVADSSVCDVTLTDGGELILTAKRPGRTDLLLWRGERSRQTLTIQVGLGDPAGLAEALREILGEIPGLVVKRVEDRIVLDGKILTRRDLLRVKTVAEAYPSVLNLTTMDLTGHDALLASEIREKIGFPLVEAEILRDRVILKGTAFREEDRTAAAVVAAAYFPEVANLIRLQSPPVEIDVKFVSIRSSKSDRSGFNVLKRLGVSATAEAGGGGSDLSRPVFALSAEAAARLEVLKGSGDAVVVAEPFLTTLSGKEASFHSGGEQGYRVAGTGVADVKFKKFGLILEILPEVYSTGEVKTHLVLEVSAPSPGGGGADADLAYTSFRTESDLIARPDTTIVVAGLAEGIRDRFREKTPIVGDIPILSAFFKEKGDRSERKDLVLLVTPRVPLLFPTRERPASSRIRPDLADPDERIGR